MHALDAIADWDVELAAAAVIDQSGIISSYGDLDTPYPLASVTKLLSAYAVLVAVEEGTTSLEDPAGPKGACVAHLLSHASGLGRDVPERVVAPPATRRVYSNVGFDVVAHDLEHKAGMSFFDYAHDAVLEPLEMAHTKIERSAAFGSSGTVRDLARFAGELLAPRLIDQKTFARAVTTAYPGLPGILPGYGRMGLCDWGLGFELRHDKSPHWTGAHNSPRTFGHFGQSGTFLWVDPDADVALVVLTNRAFSDWARTAWPALADAVLAELAPRPIQSKPRNYAQGP